MSRDSEQRRDITVAEEQLNVDKRRETTGRVRVHKTVSDREVVVDEPLHDMDVEVRRVPVGEFVDEPAETRQEGETTIVPVHEEVVVTEKRLRLKEEIHLIRREVVRHRPRKVVVRREEVDITGPDESEIDEQSNPREER